MARGAEQRGSAFNNREREKKKERKMAAESDFEGSLKVVRQTLGEKLGFRRRAFWFVLHDNVLSWHPRRGEPAADFFLLQDAREIAADGQTGIVLHTDRGQALLLAAPSLDDREKWLSALVRIYYYLFIFFKNFCA